MAVITRYIDPDAAVGGDGTTSNLTGSTCAYKSLNLWEAARQGTLSTDGNIERGVCQSVGQNHNADNTRVVIDGSTTSTTCYMEIVPADESAHGGKWSTSKYRLESAYDGYLMSIRDNYVRVIGIQVHNTDDTGTSANCIDVYNSGALGGVYIVGCLLNAPKEGQGGVYCSSSGASFTVLSCIIYNPSSQGNTGEGIYIQNCNTINIINSVVYNFNDGIEVDAGTVNVTNCAVFGNNDDFDGTMTISYCASDDGDGTNPIDISPDASEQDGWRAAFTDPDKYDFSIKDTNSCLYRTGINVSSVASFADALGVTRRSTAYIDTFEYSLDDCAAGIWVDPSSASPSVLQSVERTASHAYGIGNIAGSQYKFFGKITTAYAHMITGVSIHTGSNNGSPSGLLTIRIETVDENNVATGTLAHANATATVSLAANSWLSVTYTAFDLAAGTYAIVVSLADQATSGYYCTWSLCDPVSSDGGWGQGIKSTSPPYAFGGTTMTIQYRLHGYDPITITKDSSVKYAGSYSLKLSLPGTASNNVAARSFPTSRYIGFYNGYKTTSGSYGVARLTSADLSTWTRSSSAGILGGVNVGDWDYGGVHYPAPIYKDGIFYVFFDGWDSDVSHRQVGLAFTSDGVSFKKYASNPVLPVGSSGAWDANYAYLPIVLYDETESNSNYRWKMWYCGGAATGDLSIGYAHSADGLSWTKHADAVLTKGTGSAWDNRTVIYPLSIYKEGSTFYLWYVAQENLYTSVGVATFTDPEGTYTKSGSNPLLTPRSSATQSITATVSSGATTVHVTDSSVFSVGEPVLIKSALTSYQQTVVASKPDATTITIADVAATNYNLSDSPLIVSCYYANVIITGIHKVGTSYKGMITGWNAISGSVAEVMCYGTMSSLGGAISYDFTSAPILPITQNGTDWDASSRENGRVMYPIQPSYISTETFNDLRLDLSSAASLSFKVYCSSSGSNLFKVGVHDTGGTTTETTFSISSANTWETKTIDLSAVATANKNLIDKITITFLAGTNYSLNFDSLTTPDRWDIGAIEYVVDTGPATGSASDGASYTDSVAVRVILAASVGDGTTLSDNSIGRGVYVVTSSDGTLFAEIVSNGLAVTATASDSFVVTDTLTQTSIFDVSCDDGLSITDTQGKLISQFTQLADSLRAGDTSATFSSILATLVEGISLTEQSTATQTSPHTLTDGMRLEETLVSTQLSTKSISDGITTGDTLTFLARFFLSLTDGVTLTDSVLYEADNTFIAAVADGIAFSETLTKQATHLTSTSDGVRVSEVLAIILSLQAALSDGISYNDRTDWTTIVVALADEGIILSDAASQIMKKIAFAADSIVMTDAGTVRATYNITVSDTVNMLDVLTTAMTLFASLTDGANFSDASFDAGISVTGTVRIAATWRKVGLDITVRKTSTGITVREVSTTLRQPK